MKYANTLRSKCEITKKIHLSSPPPPVYFSTTFSLSGVPTDTIGDPPSTSVVDPTTVDSGCNRIARSEGMYFEGWEMRKR